MATFSQQITSTDRIEVKPQRLWDILTDPVALADLTPLVSRIDVDGDRWRWHLVGVGALGVSIAPTLTTLMDVRSEEIVFASDPAVGDRATADGVLTVAPDGPDHTVIGINLVASVDLPLPKVTTRAVQQVMVQTMKVGGSRFAENLIARLGSPAHSGLDVRVGSTPV